MYVIDYDKMKPAESVAKEANKRSNVGYAIPDNIAMNMVELIDSSWFIPKSFELNGNKLLLDEYANNHRVLDICCNSGILLYWFLQRFRAYLTRYAKTSFNDSEDELCEYIIKNLLYGASINSTICRIIRGMLYNNRDVYGNIYNCDVLNATHHEDSDEIELRGSEVYIYDRSKGEKVPMKFDVVCGNPPYNNDMYIGFVMLGHRLAKTYDLWITPAKWQAKLGERNDSFRELIAPYISNLIFYKNPLDVFPDTPMGNDSLSIYLVDKIKHEDKTFTIGNKTTLVKNWNIEDGFDVNSDYRKIKTLVLSKSAKLLDSSLFHPQKSYFTSKNFGEVDNGRIIEDSNSPYILKNAKRTFSIATKDLKHLDEIDSYKCYISGYLVDCPLVNILEPNEISVRGDVLLGFGDKFTCESIKSYYQSRLIWYLIYGLNMGNLNTDAFKFVPDPGSFDKIYEDKPLDGYTPDVNGCYKDANGVVHCSLYVKYKLTQNEISVIESAIRERA